MAADWHGIRAAIATKCASVAGVNSASADDIEATADTPAIRVTHVAGIEIIQRNWSMEHREADIAGVLVVTRAPGGGSAAETADSLIELLYAEFRTGINLGYPAVVQDSYLRSATFDEIAVGNVTYYGYRLHWYVSVRETVTRDMNET